MLLIGHRGSGKTYLLRDALDKAKSDAVIKDNLIEIHINGHIHTGDRIALHSIAKQLQRSCNILPRSTDLLNFGDEDASEEEADFAASEVRMRSFAKHLRWLLAGLRKSDGSLKALLVILEEFELFAAHRNQALLYNLLDISCCAFYITINKQYEIHIP